MLSVVGAIVVGPTLIGRVVVVVVLVLVLVDVLVVVGKVRLVVVVVVEVLVVKLHGFGFTDRRYLSSGISFLSAHFVSLLDPMSTW